MESDSFYNLAINNLLYIALDLLFLLSFYQPHMYIFYNFNLRMTYLQKIALISKLYLGECGHTHVATTPVKTQHNSGSLNTSLVPRSSSLLSSSSSEGAIALTLTRE